MGRKITIYCENCFNKMSKRKQKIFRKKLFLGKKNITTTKMFYKVLSLGIGFSSAHEYFENNFSDKEPPIYSMINELSIKEDINLLLNNNAKVTNGYYTIYYCRNCFEIYNKFYFKIESNDKYYEPKYICDKCNNILIIIKHKIIDNKIFFNDLCGNELKVLCKECNSSKIIIDLGMLGIWD